MNLVDLFKSIVWDSIIKYLVAQILVSLSLSASGPLGWLIGEVVVYLGNKFYKVFVMFADVGTIKLRNAVHQAQFDSAAEKLSIILSESGPDSKEFKDAHAKEQQDFYNVFTFKSDPLNATSSSSGV